MLPSEKKGYIRKPDFGSDHAALRHGREGGFAEKRFERLVLPAQEQVDRYCFYVNTGERNRQTASPAQTGLALVTYTGPLSNPSKGKIEPLFWMHTV